MTLFHSTCCGSLTGVIPSFSEWKLHSQPGSTLAPEAVVTGPQEGGWSKERCPRRGWRGGALRSGTDLGRPWGEEKPLGQAL